MTKKHDVEKILTEGSFVPDPTFQKTLRHRLVADEAHQGQPAPNGALSDKQISLPRRNERKWLAALISLAALGVLLAAIGGVALLLNNTPVPFVVAPQVANVPPESRIVPIQPLVANPPAPLYQLGTLGKGIVTHASLSPDERFLLVITETNVSVYDAITLDELWNKTMNAGLPGGGGGGATEPPEYFFTGDYYYSVHTTGWRDGGNSLLLASGDLVTEVDSASGQPLHTTTLPESIVYHAISPDGTLISGMPMNNPNAMLVWHIESRALVGEFDRPNLPQGGFIVTQWSPDNQTLAMGFHNGSTMLWNIAGLSDPQTLGPVDGSIAALDFSADGTRLAATYLPYVPNEADGDPSSSLSGSGGIIVWDTSNGASILGMPTGGKFPDSLSLSPDGTTLATWFEGVPVLLDAATGEVTATLDGAATQIAFSPSGQQMVLSGTGAVELLNLATNEKRSLPDYLGGMGVPAFSPNGSTLAIPTSSGFYTWAMSNGQLTQHGSIPGSVTQAGWLADNTQVALLVSNSVWLLNSQTGEARSLLDYPPGPPANNEPFTMIHSIDVNPQGTLLAIGMGTYSTEPPGMLSGSVLLLDLQTGAVAASQEFEQSILSVDWSPDGALLAARSQQYANGLFFLLDTSLQTMRTLGSGSGFGQLAAWSPDGSLLAAADRQEVSVWNTATGEVATRITPPFQPQSIAFLPGGQDLLVTGAETTLWDMASGAMLVQLPRYFQSVAVSPDGARLAAIEGWDSGQLTLWGIAPSD